MSTPTFSIAIVNYNGGAYVQAALDSLAKQTRRDFEVILVDNASIDGSVDNLDTSGLPGFKLLQQETNLGFARSNNIAAEEAKGKWLVLLNPDAQAFPNWLDEIRTGINRHPDVVSFACAQISMEDDTRLDGAGDCYLGFGIPWRGGYGLQRDTLPQEGTVFSACGASAVYQRETFLSFGGFDERLFCYCEDVDLGYRMRLAGEQCVFLPNAKIAHAGGGLSGRASTFSVKHGARNRLWVYLKNTPAPLLLLTLPMHVGFTFAILVRGLFTGRAKPTAHGLWMGLADLGPVLKDRRTVQKNRSVSLSSLVTAMAWNPMTMLKRKPVVRAKVLFNDGPAELQVIRKQT